MSADSLLSSNDVNEVKIKHKINTVIIDTQSRQFDNQAEQLLLKAQQLRTNCFKEQFGVVFDNDLDADRYDEACFHLILLDGEDVIATARLLDSDRANLLGRFYSDNEFDLQDFLRDYPYPVLEIGRTCIASNYRGASVLMQLWQGIAQVAEQVKANAFMGCCSIPIGAGDVNAWLANLKGTPKIDIRPKHRLPLSLLSQPPVVPSLLNMYLRMGANVASQACFDPDFHCADVFVWLPFEQFNPRYQHFLR